MVFPSEWEDAMSIERMEKGKIPSLVEKSWGAAADDAPVPGERIFRIGNCIADARPIEARIKNEKGIDAVC